MGWQSRGQFKSDLRRGDADPFFYPLECFSIFPDLLWNQILSTFSSSHSSFPLLLPHQGFSPLPLRFFKRFETGRELSRTQDISGSCPSITLPCAGIKGDSEAVPKCWHGTCHFLLYRERRKEARPCRSRNIIKTSCFFFLHRFMSSYLLII